MISSIHIEGFRGFERFDMEELGHVNLLVGTNNSGKTSLLEALHLLTSRADPRALWKILWRRGENGIDKNSAIGTWLSRSRYVTPIYGTPASG